MRKLSFSITYYYAAYFPRVSDAEAAIAIIIFIIFDVQVFC